MEGAKDFLCSSCVERRPPGKTTPGSLRDPIDFNEKVSVDGFEWQSKSGLTVYVLHVLDESTRFHVGQRITRDGNNSIRMMKQLWMSWAGPPKIIAHDQGGEFISQPWKDFLQTNGIQPYLSAAPWQRGRIERHGGIVQEMLERMDNERGITSVHEFDDILNQCFHAKNNMSIVNGYSPEQAVLGRASRLPASIVGDEETTAHLLSWAKMIDPNSFVNN